MTDIELMKLSAEAMGYQWFEEPTWHMGPGWIARTPKGDMTWNPLKDGSQAMMLVEHLHLTVAFGYPVPPLWDVYPTPHNGINATDSNLKRAICECAAKMEKAKA